MTVGERFREPGYRELLLRLLTNKLTEQCARSLRVEGTRIYYRTSLLTGRTWFSAGRIELHSEDTPITIECALSVKWWSLLFPLACCVLLVTSLFMPETMSPRGAAVIAAMGLIGRAVAFWVSVGRLKETIREQIARADSEASLRASVLAPSA